MTDPQTQAELRFLTSHAAADINLYYHQRSWLSDSKTALFYSDRPVGGLMACLLETGEVVRITGPDGKALTGATAAIHRNTIFAVWNENAIEIELKLRLSDRPGIQPSQVRAQMRVIGPLAPTHNHAYTLNESCDGRYLAYGAMGFGKNGGPTIHLIEVQTGLQQELVSLPPDRGPAHHVQWSRTNPSLLSFSSFMEPYKFRAGPRVPSAGPEDYAGRCQRLWVIDIRDRVPRNIYQAIENELVTHAVWWINDTILFTGAIQAPVDNEWSHVKVLDVVRGDVRIIGAGSWWPGAAPEEMSRLNWWHPSGSDDGQWVVADNWHGDLMLFEGRTGRPHLLTQNHRTYGSGEHPHPSWSRNGKQVIFTSHRLGSADVCIAAVPAPLQELVDSNTDGLGDPILHHKIIPQGKILFQDNFRHLDHWHLEGHTSGVSLTNDGWLRLDCTGSQQGGVGAHAFLREDMPDSICLQFDLLIEKKNGLVITFLGLQGRNGEDAITEIPRRRGLFAEYTGEHAAVRSYHLSLSRYDDQGVHTGVSNWRRNPGLVLVGHGPDPCTEINRIYRVAIIKQGRRCQLQVDGEVVSGFIDREAADSQAPGPGKIGFRVIGAQAVARIAHLRVTALE
ncbi:MAG TPA: DUF1961 family protein [bacterium]|nr:DUF1961 family protein [bacterium]HPN35842.1 DUF1961 family protein [bacterium]